MTQAPTIQERYGYFRLGLVTGLLDKENLVNWADAQIMAQPVPCPKVIELSVCGSRPYSEIIWLLGEYEGQSRCEWSLKLLLAHAGLIVENAPEQSERLILGLRLLKEEEYLAKALHAPLTELEDELYHFQQGDTMHQDLVTQLTAFLAPYAQFRSELEMK